MDKDLKQYLDEQFGLVKTELADVKGQVETLAVSTAQQFERIDKRFDEVDKRFDEVDQELGIIKERLGTVETNTEMMAREQRALREELEDNVKPRLSNLEAQVNRA